jgi:hypothetical protein
VKAFFSMKDDSEQSRFLRNLLKADSILSLHNIAKLESHKEPDFTDPKNPVYAEAVFIPRNHLVFEDIIHYINKSARKFRNNTVARPVYHTQEDRYELVIIPDPKIPKSRWLEETEDFPNHIF